MPHLRILSWKELIKKKILGSKLLIILALSIATIIIIVIIIIVIIVIVVIGRLRGASD